MKFISLFAGIGGFDLGFERAGHQCVAQVEIDPKCRQTLAEHWPDVPKFDDVRTVGAHNLPQCDAVIGGFPCFPAGTLILTKRGNVPIETVRIGDYVFTHAGKWQNVTSVMSRISENTLTLKGGFCPGLITTSEHPIYASSGKIRKYKPQSERGRGNWYDILFSAPEWINAESMNGMYWASPIISGQNAPPKVEKTKNNNSSGKQSKSLHVSPALMWIIGAWVGDGWIRRRKDRCGNISGLVVSCPESETDYFLKKAEDASLKVTVAKCRTTDKLIVSSRALGEWVLNNFGEHCHSKSIPSWMYECEDKFKRAFLDGYVWADGCINDSEGGWQATTVSKSLSIGIAMIAQSLGFFCSIYHEKREGKCVIEGRTCNQRSTYQIVGRFKKKQSSNFRIDNHAFSLCRSVIQSGEMRVFNISVNEDESYVADGIVVHNCQGLSVAGARKGLADERSGLFYEMTRITHELRPDFLIWENVPGLLSSDNRRDFARVLLELDRIRYHGVWTGLDAQFFGLAQRRRRIFGVFARRDIAIERCIEILSIPDRLRRDLAPRQRARQDLAGNITTRSGRSCSTDEAGAGTLIAGAWTANACHTDENSAQSGHLVADTLTSNYARNGGRSGGYDSKPARNIVVDRQLAAPLVARQAKGGFTDPVNDNIISFEERYVRNGRGKPSGIVNALRADAGGWSGKGDSMLLIAFTSQDYGQDATKDIVPTLRAQNHDKSHSNGGGQIAIVEYGYYSHEYRQDSIYPTSGVANALATSRTRISQSHYTSTGVRRLTPTECERLQGFPDEWTAMHSDSVRYHQLGNAVAVSVAEWIGKRIATVLGESTP